LVTEESDQHQYRFENIVDMDDGRVLFTVEHEVRSMRHPLYARPLVNRNPEQSNRLYAPGYEELSCALPLYLSCRALPRPSNHPQASEQAALWIPGTRP